MIQQIDIDHIRELSSDTPVPVSQVKENEVFSFARFNPMNFYKFNSALDEDTALCSCIAGSNNYLTLRIPLNTEVWSWKV